jgi:hypothetical protein
MSLPIVIFDTSALSALAKGGAAAEPYVKALGCGFDVWITAMSVDEIVATTDPGKRELQLGLVQRLLASGRCIWPPHEVTTLLCSAHARNPSAFDWRRVNIRATIYERAIINREFTEKLCAEQLAAQKKAEQEFIAFWLGLRSKLNPLWAREPTRKRPSTYRRAARMAQSGRPSMLLGIGAELYQRGAKLGANIEAKPSDAEVEVFMRICPPFRAICYGMLGTWFDVSLALQVFKKLAGRNDHMMSIYLPYCGRFVAQDAKQVGRLRDIAAETGLDCCVLSDREFLASFEPGLAASA